MTTPCFQHDSYRRDCGDCRDMNGDDLPMTDGTNPVIELKPCPFCGVVPSRRCSDGVTRCLNSDCGRVVETFSVEDWNTRAAPPANPVIVERVRLFPMQHGPSIPWPLAELIYEAYSALYGKQQSLERLSERGGFGWAEVEILLKELKRKNSVLHASIIERGKQPPPQAALEAMPDVVEGLRRFVSIVDSAQETGFDPRLEQQLMDLADELRALAKVSGVSNPLPDSPPRS